MRITVLGKSPSWQDVGGACSSYLVQEQGFTLLLDCGTGSFAKLRAVIDYFAIDAVLISHLHSDHFFDLVPFSYALTLSPRRASRQDNNPPALHAPPGARVTFRNTVGAWGSEGLIEGAFSVAEYDPAEGVAVGPFRARFCEVPHFTQTFAVDLRAGPKRFTFGADSGPSEALVAFARDTDLLMLEATLSEPDADGEKGHMTPRQAGEHAARARAHELVITHFSDELDSQWLSAQASEGFGAPVQLAAEGAVYVV